MRFQSFLGLAVLALSACAGGDMADYDHRERFATTVESRSASATIARPAEGAALAATDAQVLRDLAAEHLRRGAAPVVIEIGKDDAPFGETVVARLVEAGIPRDRIQITAAGEPAATATVRVPIWVANVPECGRWEERISPDFRNENTWNFGCSVTRNIGLMVSNPADLVRAREASGRDGNRAVDVLTKYGEGKPTASGAEAPPPAIQLNVK